MTDQPSLGRFVLERLEEDLSRALAWLPAFPSDLPEVVAARFLDRGLIASQIRAEREIVLACTRAMQDAQGPAPKGPQPDPVTALGGEVIKRIAQRFDDHPDYREDWRP